MNSEEAGDEPFMLAKNLWVLVYSENFLIRNKDRIRNIKNKITNKLKGIMLYIIIANKTITEIKDAKVPGGIILIYPA